MTVPNEPVNPPGTPSTGATAATGTRPGVGDPSAAAPPDPGAPSAGAQPAAGGPTETRPAAGDPADASLGDILGTITQDFTTLVRQELDLAKAEISQTVNKAGKGAGLFGGAGIAGYFVLLFLSLALWWAIGAMIGLGDARPALGWSALIVAGIWAVVAAILAVVGRKELKEAEGIPQTTETVKHIPDAVKGQEH